MGNANSISRRKFIQDAAKVGLSLSTVGCASVPLSQTEQVSKKESVAARDPIFNNSERYQYIIVGAGAGGGPLAVRLARRGYDVLLLDAGSDSLPESATIPAFHGQSTEDPEIAWDYFVKHRDEVPQLDVPGVATMKNQSNIWYPRASGIGGCTSHNAMIAMYPHPDDWQRIYDQARLSGDAHAESWHPRKMRNLFEDRVERKDYRWGDNTGWHHLELNSAWPGIKDSNLRATLLAASNSRDNGSIFDLLRVVNRRRNIDKEGFFMIPKSTRDGSRYGVFHYVMENRGQTGLGKLTVLPHALVRKVQFRKNRNGSIRATGVTVAIGKSLYRAHRQGGHNNYETREYRADNEVVLCAGAFNTPQLLMLSGIGPGKHFESSTWKQIRDGKKWLELDGVGQNLQDRYEVSVVSQFSEDFRFIADCEFSPDINHDPCYGAWQEPDVRKKSIYASNGVVGGFKLRSKQHQQNGRPQDLILFGVPGDFRGYYPGYSANIFGPDGHDHNRFSWAILKGYSNNRSGQIRLKSPDFRDTPDIHFNYFGEGREQDLEAIYEAIQVVRKTNAKLGNRIEKELFPGNRVVSERDVKIWVEREAWGHHASCTAKMGHRSDTYAVVDYNFKVHGTQNLRIVDASVFPEIPGLFITVPIYTIAEKAADVIDKEHERTKENR